LKSMESTALDLGRTTSFTAAEVANLMTELARGGIKPDAINNMTDAVLNLSRATGTEAAMSAEIMATTLNQFSLGAGEATRVADVFTASANSTLNTVEKLGEAMKFAAPVAQDLGMSLEDTAAIVAILGNVGIQGTMAGAAIRRLGAVTGAEAERMRSVFGVSFLDATGDVLPLIDILEKAGEATANLTRGQRMAKMKDAFGLLGITAAASLGKAAGSVKDLVKKLNDLDGTAEQTAAKMDAGVGGSLRKLISAVDGLSIAFAKKLEPTFDEIALQITKVTGNLDKWIKPFVKAVAAIVAVSAAMKALTLATKAYTVAMIFASGVSGPAGWFNLGVGLAAAAGAMLTVESAMGDMGDSIAAVNGILPEYEVRMATAEEKLELFSTKAKESADRFTDAYLAMLPPVKEVSAALETERGAAIWEEQTKQSEDLRQALLDIRSPAQAAADDLAKFVKQVRLFVVPEQRQDFINQFIDNQSGFSSAMKSATDDLAVLQGSVTKTDLMLAEMGKMGASTQQLDELRAVLDEIEKIETQKDNAAKIKSRGLTPSQQRGSAEALTTILKAQQGDKKTPQVKEQQKTNGILRGMAAVMERQKERDTLIQEKIA
jgi:TP901 family phage tail tape measure protein